MVYIFYMSLITILYIFLGYPMLIFVMARIRSLPVEKKEEYPFVSILLSVYNERKKIERRVRNLLDLDYPRENVEILVGSDGSIDGTNEILNELKNEGVKVSVFEQRRGKASVINDLAKKAKGDLLIFADCRQDWEKDSLKMLIRNFADEKVGVVSGVSSEGEKGFYRRYDNFIRQQESVFNSIPGSCGPFYGMRLQLFKNLPHDTILDDFVIPMEAVRHGYRSIMEPEAVAHDITFTMGQERIRKVRTLAGNFQTFFRYPWLLNPFKNPIWLQTVSHKVLRLIVPVLLVLFFVLNAILYNNGNFYRMMFFLQILFYMAGFIGMKNSRFAVSSNPAGRLILLAGTFLELNWATVLGLWCFLTRRSKVTWDRYNAEN